MYQGYDYDVDRRQGRSRTGDHYNEQDRDRNRWSPGGGGDRRMDADDLYEYRDDDYRSGYYNTGNPFGRRFYGSGPSNEGWRERGNDSRYYGAPSRNWDDIAPSYGQNYRDYGNRFGMGQQFSGNRTHPGIYGDSYRNTMGSEWSYRPNDQQPNNSWQNSGMGSSTNREYWGRDDRGQFTGKGPKGYRRSDERIQEDVNEALAGHPHLDASDIEVKVQNGEVRLSGTVTERTCKRMAEDIAENCSGVHDVRNELRVQHHSDFDSDSPSTSQQHKGKMSTGSSTRSESVKA